LEQAYIRTGKVRYIYRPYVWDPQGDQADRLAAEALYCAGEQGKFWEMHDWLYANAGSWSASPDIPTFLAQSAAPAVGLDGTTLADCLRQERYRSRIEAIVQDAQNRNIQGTPTFLIQNKTTGQDQVLDGGQPFANFQQAIEGTVAGPRVPAEVWLLLAIGVPAVVGLIISGGGGPRTTPRTLLFRLIIAGLALLGLLVAIYLSLYELQLSGSLLCPDKGCGDVNQSSYVFMFGIPIGLIGVIGYSTVLAGTLARMKRRFLFGIPVSLILVVLGAIGFLFSAFLTYLEFGPIGATCTWCMVSTALMTAIMVLAVLAWPAEREPGERRARRAPATVESRGRHGAA
jgi:uncharacterized membrane protein